MQQFRITYSVQYKSVLDKKEGGSFLIFLNPWAQNRPFELNKGAQESDIANLFIFTLKWCSPTRGSYQIKMTK